MSFYSRLIDLRPLPSPELYDEAHAMTDELLGSGGSWEDVTTQFAALSSDRELKSQFLVASQYGFMLRDNELTDLASYQHEAPKFLVGRAFTQGFVQQVAPSQLVYSGKYSLVNGLEILHSHYAAQNFKKLKDKDDIAGTQERIRVFNSQYVCALGEYGLSRVGEKSTQYINKWAVEAYPADARLARAFRLGHGAMIICALQYQAGLNDHLIKVASTQVNLDEEARSILTPSTSEDE